MPEATFGRWQPPESAQQTAPSCAKRAEAWPGILTLQGVQSAMCNLLKVRQCCNLRQTAVHTTDNTYLLQAFR
eukprot:15434523-Alexandrium_andersonii.AAC.1